MRKYFLIIFLVIFLGINLNCAFAFEKSDRQTIKTILNNHTKALKTHDIEKVKMYYDKAYRSADGFDIDDMTGMLEKTYKAYTNIKYDTEINNITIFNDCAIAQLTDRSFAKVYPEGYKKAKSKMGILEGKSVYVVYLKKEGDSWKIIYDDILMEETSLKYGIANKINIDLITPVFIQNGQEYDIALKIDKPKDILALASLSREEIVYPPKNYTEKFRLYPSDGNILERVVKANKDNLDEYAIASIGFTKLSINQEETRAKVEVLGIAYVMKRINMEIVKNLPKISDSKTEVK